MAAIPIDGKAIASQRRKEIMAMVDPRFPPGLATILIGNNPASSIYVQNKRKACEEVGIYAEGHTFPESVSEAELLALVHHLNHDKKIHGILVQLPLPKTLPERKILDAIAVEKDVDGFHYENAGKLISNEKGLIPCAALAIVELLRAYNVTIAGAHAVVVGAGLIVGKPTALLLLHHGATVTICHVLTKNLGTICREADILVTAIGQPKFIKKEMVKEGAVILDVGINRLADSSIVGDVDFDAVVERASLITPVPGGVGPMTIAMLLSNTLQAEKNITRRR